MKTYNKPLKSYNLSKYSTHELSFMKRAYRLSKFELCDTYLYYARAYEKIQEDFLVVKENLKIVQETLQEKTKHHEHMMKGYIELIELKEKERLYDLQKIAILTGETMNSQPKSRYLRVIH